MPITDNFDSYTDGDLNGQGSWSGDAAFDVQGTVVQAGAKAIVHETASTGSIKKTGTIAATGVQSFYFRCASVSVDEIMRSDLFEGTQPVIRVKVNASGNLQYFNGAAYVTIQAVSTNTWYKLDIEWRTSDDQARYRVDNGTWTAFDNIWNPITTGVDGINFAKGTANASATYYDTLADGADATVIARRLTMMGVGR